MNPKRAQLISKYFEKITLSQHKVTSAEVIGNKLIQANFQQYNFRENISHTYSSLLRIGEENKFNPKPLNTFPIPQSLGTQQVASISPNSKYRAILQNFTDKQNAAKKKQVIEIYNQHDLIDQINVDEFHEKVENSAMIGKPFVWNAKENKFLYIATPKQEKGKSFLESDLEKEQDLKECLKLNKHVFDCGEQMQGTIEPKLYEYNFDTKSLFEIKIPPNLVPCYPQYLDEEGSQIAFAAFKIPKEFLYGILHCFNRQSDIYMLEKPSTKQLLPKKKKVEGPEVKDQENKQQQLEKENKDEEEEKVEYKILSISKFAFKPTVSPDFKKLLYYAGDQRLPHLNYLSMHIVDLKNGFKIEEVVKYSFEEKQNEQFMGVCGFYDDLKESFWLANSRHFIFSTAQQGSKNIYILDTQSKQVESLSSNNNTQLNNLASLLSYDLTQNILLTSYENPIMSQRLQILTNLEELYIDNDVSNFAKKANWDSINFQGENSVTQIEKFLNHNFQQTLLKTGQARGYLWSFKKENVQIEDLQQFNLPQFLVDLWDNKERQDLRKLKDENKKPLLVLVHGGPHGYVSGLFSLTLTYFLLNGFNVLSPDFTGSAGYGQKFMEDLLGHIGEKDTEEIVEMINQVKNQNLCDPANIVIMGGSYGGYMSAIMAARKPELFKCAVLLNPCLNLPFMVNITDIPEWVSAEVLNKEIDWNFSTDDYKKLLEKSPMLGPAKIPVILLVGAKDKRVPWQAALSYQAQARQAGTECQLYVYPESDHALSDSLATSFDVIMKSIIFIEGKIN